MVCPGSVDLIKKAPPEEESPYAAEGTAAHELAEWCLVNNGLAETAIGMEFNGFTVDEEMAEAVQVYVDTVESYYDGKNTQVYVEEKFHLSHIHEQLYGTNDACVVDAFGKVTIFDYKHGKGVAVDVVENRQLMYYALGAVFGMDLFTEVELVIVQPRADHPDGKVRKWNVPIPRLQQFEKELKAAAELALSGKGHLQPSDKGCKFCPARGMCPALKKQVYNDAMVAFDDVSEEPTLPSPDSLSNEQIVQVLKAAEMIKGFVDGVQKHAHLIVERGEKLPGYKLVQKRAYRKWKDEEQVVDAFSDLLGLDQMYEHKLLSPSKLEKVIGKKEVAEFCYTPDNGTVLVPETDRRKEIKPAIEQAFDDDLDI
jgi:hypothetical protein